MNKKYTIKDLFFLLLGRLPFLILALIVGAGAAFTVTKFWIPPKYQSNVSLYVKNSSENSTEQNNVLNQNDLSVSKSLVSTYIVILNNDVVMDEVSTELLKSHDISELESDFSFDADGNIKSSSLKNCFAMTAVNETEVLQITATTKSAELSQELCDIMAGIAPEYLTRVVGAGSVEKIGDAKLYPEKVSPNVTKNTALGGMAGLLIAVLIVFVLDFFDNTLKDVNEIQDHYKKPILGEMQRIGAKKKKRHTATDSERKEKLIFQEKEIPFSVIENYKALRTNLIFALSTAEQKVLAVSSANASEGKSTTIANLAYTMAEAEKKILLIDGDMRKPVQHKHFGLKNKTGLSAILSGEKTFADCVNRDVKKNLDVLTSGVIPPNPSELMASNKMKNLLEQVSESYDYILIDTPPLLQVSDAIGMADWIAGIALVLKYGSTTNYELDAVLHKLELGNCNLTGFILNEISGEAGGYYSHYGKYGYKYKYGYSKYGYRKPEGYGSTNKSEK